MPGGPICQGALLQLISPRRQSTSCATDCVDIGQGQYEIYTIRPKYVKLHLFLRVRSGPNSKSHVAWKPDDLSKDDHIGKF